MKVFPKFECCPPSMFIAFLLGIIIGFIISPIKKGVYLGNRDINY